MADQFVIKNPEQILNELKLFHEMEVTTIQYLHPLKKRGNITGLYDVEKFAHDLNLDWNSMGEKFSDERWEVFEIRVIGQVLALRKYFQALVNIRETSRD